MTLALVTHVPFGEVLRLGPGAAEYRELAASGGAKCLLCCQWLDQLPAVAVAAEFPAWTCGIVIGICHECAVPPDAIEDRIVGALGRDFGSVTRCPVAAAGEA